MKAYNFISFSVTGLNQCKNCERFKTKLIPSPITKELNEMYNLKDGKGKNCNNKWNCQKLKKKKSHNASPSTAIPSTSLLNETQNQSTQQIMSKLSQLDLSAASLEHFSTITTNTIPVKNVPQSLQTISSVTSPTAIVLENSPLGGLVVLRMDQRQPLLDFSR